MNDWGLVQYDSETNGLDPHINTLTCIQLGNRKDNAQIVIDVSTIDIQKFKNILESKFLIGHNLKFDLQFLYSQNIIPLKVYDTMVVEQLRYLGYPPAGRYGGISYGLAEVANRYKNVNLDKSIREDFAWRGLDEATIKYAAEDVVHLEDIMDAQIRWMRANNMIKGAELECNFVPAIAYLEWCGIKLDEKAWESKMEIDKANMLKAKEALNDYVVKYYKDNSEDSQGDFRIIEKFKVATRSPNPHENKYYDLPKDVKVIREAEDEAHQDNTISKYLIISRPFPYVQINRQGDLFTGFDTEPKCIVNWASSQQVVKLVNLFGFNTWVKNKATGIWGNSVNADILKKQKGINDEFLNAYLEYKEVEKVVSTYGDNYLNAINPKTGRIHTIFRQLGADTGRMSCGSTNSNKDLAKLKKLNPKSVIYPQLQNLPSDKVTRSCFVASEGNLMASIDYSNMENRLGADIYNEPNMIAEYLTGEGDIHSLVAKISFKELKNKTTSEIKKDFAHLRNKAKAVGFAKQFGGSAHAISNSLSISLEEAEEIERAYSEGFAGIETFKKEGSKKVRDTGYVIINPITGHRLNWHDWGAWKARQKEYDQAFWEHYRDIKEASTEEEWEGHPLRKKVSRDFKTVSKYERMSLNAVTQGTGVIILKEAVTKLFHYIVNNGYFKTVLIVNLVHDEIIIEYPESIPSISDITVKMMEETANKYCKAVPIPAEASVGKYWIH